MGWSHTLGQTDGFKKGHVIQLSPVKRGLPGTLRKKRPHPQEPASRGDGCPFLSFSGSRGCR